MEFSSWLPKAAKRLFFLLTLFLLLSCLLTTRYRDPGRKLPRSVVPEEKVNASWEEYFETLEAARPWADPLPSDQGTPSTFGTRPPYTNLNRPDLLRLPRQTKDGLRRAHSKFISRLATLSTHLSFQPGTTGIVTSIRPDDLGQVVTMLLMLRQSGSTLPAQVILEEEPSPSIDQFCSTALGPLGATCISPQEQDGWLEATHHLPPFQPSQWKSLAIITSTFQNVLFLDPDTLPVRNPDPIFATNVQPFHSTGFIVWADIWTPTGSPDFFAVTADTEPPVFTTRASSESGVLVIDKARHADTLLLAAYYNHYGPEYYYPLLTQHDLEDPGRESYLAAALVLDALAHNGTYTAPDGSNGTTTPVKVKKGRWNIKTPPRIYQRADRGGVPGVVVMAQMDPLEDYHAVLVAIEEYEWLQDHLQELTPRSGALHDLANDLKFLDSLGNPTVSPRKGKYMFFHHYGERLDFSRITDDMLPTDANDLYMRMWGEPNWVEASVGRDVEKMLWRDATGFWCGLEGYAKQCRLLKKVYQSVYVPNRYHR
ncbi:mannosyltransferase putative-domain-containing protein [Cercophora newfieldiana]|uniref:Mannosyltransferase putative-domain-containing protein n=1 Tax=Cercophora newfieldiana TaxID=92897 RepID=A0AA40CLL4_9PEZI|nr:mannosyltransferase putative-domain-containing protein [Cercophora newfieldiana]